MGTGDLNGFWYGWTTGGDNLPSTPATPGDSAGWTSTVSGRSIKWANGSYMEYGYTYYYGTPLAPGSSATFTFSSTSTPSEITTSPAGRSVAYVNGIDLSQGVSGDSSPVFSPAVSNAPVVPTVAASISDVADGASYDYTITLTNTSTVALNSFWYGWTTSGNNLPSDPSNAANSLGWTNTLDGNSIKWINSSGTALAPGASATFTVVSTSTPSAITTSPSGESVAYVNGIDFTEDEAGDSTAVFSPTLVVVPVVPTVASSISGVADGNSFDYTISLTNTSTVALNSFWYGWTTSGNNLPSNPTNAANSLGWGNTLDGNSIMWVNSSGTALAPGASATFTFVSTATPSAITTSPSGESVAYVNGIDFSQDAAGDSTAVFSPALLSSPVVSNSPPTLAASVNLGGAGGAAPTSLNISWPATNGGTLQFTTNLAAPVWANVTNVPSVVNGQNVVTNPITGPQQFFRLANP